MVARDDHQRIRECIRAIPDPEIPVITIDDLGILRSAEPLSSGEWLVKITPTYSGCPAMRAIEQTIIETLSTLGIKAQVELVLEPAWTTDWITDVGRTKLKNYGIAPPREKTQETTLRIASAAQRSGSLAVPLFSTISVNCPRCDSTKTALISAFGATACKEQWQCNACLEPFEHFKCH